MKTKFLNAMVWVTALFFAACSSKGDYTCAIPSDAALVASADVQQLVEKSGITGEEGKVLTDQLMKSVRSDVSEQEAAMIEKILADPAESGLDLREKVYAFMVSDMEYAAVLAAVDNRDKVTEMVNMLAGHEVCEPVAEETDYSYTTVDRKSLLAYNETAFLLLNGGSKFDTEELKAKAAALLANEKANSFISTDKFDKMQKAKGDIALSFSLDCLPREELKLLQMNMPQGVDPKDVTAVSALHFEKGKVLLDVETLYNPEIKDMIAQQEKVYGDKLKGKFLEKFPKESMTYLACSVNGEEAYKVIMQNEMVKRELRNARLPFDLEKVLKSLNGEMAFAMAAGKSMIPQFGIYAEVANDDILKEMNPFKQMLAAAGMEYGVKDDVFYVSNIKEGSLESTLDDCDWAGDSKGKLTYFVSDFQAVADFVRLGMNPSQAASLNMVANTLKVFTGYSEDVTHFHAVLTMVDTKTNSLKQFVDIAKKMNAAD